jgi:hypothetical protein
MRQWVRQIADFLSLLLYSVNDIALGCSFESLMSIAVE